MRFPSVKLFGRTTLLLVILFLLLGQNGHGQGFFNFYNFDAPTHIGSLGGPLAGTNILGQALAGLTIDNLAPVGAPIPHRGGLVGATTTVPFAPPDAFVHVQLAAWDGNLWGQSFSAVPPDQIGFTDIVSVLLDSPGALGDTSHFTISAIVPVPEPSALGLTLLCAAILAIGRRHCNLTNGAFGPGRNTPGKTRETGHLAGGQ